MRRPRCSGYRAGPPPSPVEAPITLAGRQIRLRSTVESDRGVLLAIRSTPEVHGRWRGDDLDAEFGDDLADPELELLTIEDSSGHVVGLIQFYEEDDPDYRHASIDIYIDPASHRQGYATAAIRALVDYLFEQRGHHRLTIDPAADNAAAIACYAGVGFKVVGILRDYERQADGSWSDGLLMDLLRSDL